jgi:predicted nucleic acid-binding protein
MTWRAPDRLMRQVRDLAAEQNLSMNEWVTRLAATAVADDEADPPGMRLRARLRAAGRAVGGRPAGGRPGHAPVRVHRGGPPVSVFADSSAVVKLYAEEPGADQVAALAAMYVSQLARVEVPAALWRKHHMGELSASMVADLIQAFENDYFNPSGRLAAAALTAEVLDEAAGLVAAHSLRAYDAVQLATAQAVRRADPDCEVFACFDKQLFDAAVRVGFRPLGCDDVRSER